MKVANDVQVTAGECMLVEKHHIAFAVSSRTSHKSTSSVPLSFNSCLTEQEEYR